jgi:hypothetical protein
VVALAKPRPAIIYSSGGEAGAMESVNFVARRRGERNVDRPGRVSAIADPEKRFAFRVESRMSATSRLVRRDLHQNNDRERQKRLFVESLGAVEIGHRSHVVEHFVPLPDDLAARGGLRSSSPNGDMQMPRINSVQRYTTMYVARIHGTRMAMRERINSAAQ